MNTLAEWEKASAKYEAMTGKAKPQESVKKCWLRSNKTLSVTFKELDAEANAMAQLIKKGRAKDVAKGRDKLLKRLQSVNKMRTQHINELKNAADPKADKADLKIQQSALAYLSDKLDAIYSRAELEVAELDDATKAGGKETKGIVDRYLKAHKELEILLADASAYFSKLKTLAAKNEKKPDAAITQKIIASYSSKNGPMIVKMVAISKNIMEIIKENDDFVKGGVYKHYKAMVKEIQLMPKAFHTNATANDIIKELVKVDEKFYNIKFCLKNMGVSIRQLV